MAGSGRPWTLQMAFGGDKVDPGLLPVPISLTRTGYPTIIPAFHRAMIRKRDERAAQLVRLYLSFFSLSKIILLAKRIKKDTFKSIGTRWSDQDRIVSLIGDFKEFIEILTWRYLPFIRDIPWFTGMSWEPTLQALPSVWLENPYGRRFH